MKKTCLLLFILFVNLTVSGQIGGGKINIKELKIIESNDEVVVIFKAEIDRNMVNKGQTYLLTPVLVGGNYRVSLPSVIIDGKNTKISSERKAWSADKTTKYLDAIHTTNGKIVNYHAVVKAQSWMHGGQLVVEGIMTGCCSHKIEPMVVIADKLHLYDEPALREVITEVKHFKPKTVADSLSTMFPFVIPESMFDPEDPFKIYDEERDNSMVVYFHQSKHVIDKTYRDNDRTLFNLTAAIEIILGENNSKIERVVVAGFASPEGTFVFNDRLAFDRAVSVKAHLMATTKLKDEQIWIHNGSVDWRGLYLLVAQSEMRHRDEILYIIENTPLIDRQRNTTRLGELQKLANGSPYNYMFSEFFPLLRNGAFIKVYYSNKK